MVGSLQPAKHGRPSPWGAEDASWRHPDQRSPSTGALGFTRRLVGRSQGDRPPVPRSGERPQCFRRARRGLRKPASLHVLPFVGVFNSRTRRASPLQYRTDCTTQAMRKPCQCSRMYTAIFGGIVVLFAVDHTPRLQVHGVHDYHLLVCDTVGAVQHLDDHCVSPSYGCFRSSRHGVDQSLSIPLRHLLLLQAWCRAWPGP